MCLSAQLRSAKVTHHELNVAAALAVLTAKRSLPRGIPNGLHQRLLPTIYKPPVDAIERDKRLPWTYWVRLRGAPTAERVSVDAYAWNGACTCPAFMDWSLKLLHAGMAPHDDLRCDHILAARAYAMQWDVPTAVGGASGAGSSSVLPVTAIPKQAS